MRQQSLYPPRFLSCPPAEQGTVYLQRHDDWLFDLRRLLDRAGLARQLASRPPVLIKPNLVEALAPPITTPVACVEALVVVLREMAGDLDIVIGEGVGAREYDTFHCFAELGYTEMAARLGVALVDLNEAPSVRCENPDCRRWPEMYLPQMVFERFLISVPVLKAHSLAGVTLTMKNMMGLPPPIHYQRGGHWKKSSFHEGMQDAVCDLNRYRTPDFTVLDATVGMRVAHLWGPTCDPPPNLLVGGHDPVAVDAYGAALLGRDWRMIGHIRQADGLLGQADSLTVIETDQ